MLNAQNTFLSQRTHKKLSFEKNELLLQNKICQEEGARRWKETFMDVLKDS